MNSQVDLGQPITNSDSDTLIGRWTREAYVPAEVVVAPVVEPARKRRLAAFAWRALRLVAAAVLVAVALWWWAVPFFFPVTSRAVVNARTVEVRAPIDGTITRIEHAIGDPVRAGDPLLHVSSRQVDTTQLTTLKTRQAELTARRERVGNECEETVNLANACRANFERYQRALVADLQASHEESAARVEMARTEYEGARRRLANAQGLASRQSLGAVEFDANRDSASVAQVRIGMERAAQQRTKKELDAAAQGLFLHKDAPHYQKQTEELSARLPRLRAELWETDQLLEAMGRAVAQEERRVERLAQAAVEAPVTGVVWQRPGNLNQVVRHNEAVIEVADRDTIFVEALLHQRYLSSVTPGCRAAVNLTGGQTLAGRVRAVRTPNPDEVEPAFALSLSDQDVRRVKVIIEFEPPVPDAALIGRHARVLITSPAPGPLEQAVEWVFARSRF